MLGIPIWGIGVGITLWDPPKNQGGGGPPDEFNHLIQEVGTSDHATADHVLQEDDATFIILEAG